MIAGPGELLRKHGLSPRKSWGQNFLHAAHIHDAILAALAIEPGARVVEIGAGLGTLTARLLGAGAEVWAIERDRDLCAVLRKELTDERFVLHEADAVGFDYARAARQDHPPPSVVGNLPYHLTGPLLFALLDHHAVTGRWVVMVQKEVADRLTSPPGTREYGGVTVGLSRLRAIDVVTRVSRGCFLPPPRVDSAVLRFEPRPEPLGDVDDPVGFLALVRTAFQRRRKTLLNALSAIADKDRVRAWCEQAGVEPSVRPERLDPAQFAALQRARERDA